MNALASPTRRRAAARVRTLLSLATACAVLQAAGSDAEPEAAGEETSPYNEGLALVESGDFEKALERFTAAVGEDPTNPDVLNMVAYTQRKTGDLRAAFATYARALSARSEFPQARQYLGEAHIQAAMEELLVLESYGEGSEEHLAALVDALVSAAERAKVKRPGGAGAATKW